MVSVSVSIDQAAVAKLEGLLAHLARAVPQRLAAETRRAGIYICQSFKSRTKVAPKNARPAEYRAVRDYGKAPYITNRAGRLLRRWRFTKLPGTADEKTWIAYPYTDRRRGRNGRMTGGSKSAEIREILTVSGLRPITRRGLAKKSWGWVAQGIYNGGASGMGDLGWTRHPRERRDPRDYVRGVFRRFAGGASVQLLNKLDYALDALPPSAVNEGITAAVKRLEYNVAADIMRAENAPPVAVRRSAYQSWVADTKGWRR